MTLATKSTLSKLGDSNKIKCLFTIKYLFMTRDQLFLFLKNNEISKNGFVDLEGENFGTLE